MSTDLALIKNALAQIQTGVDEDTLAVAGGSGGSKRISIEGGVFRKIVGGKEVGTVEDRHMNVVFVKMAHAASRTYYKDTYKKGVKVSPVCWSTDGKAPDVDVPAPCASSCRECPFSIKGSAQGGQGTACRTSWRTAVVLPNDPNGDVMQLVLPAASCFGEEDNGRWPFKTYVQMLANNNISASRVITKMQFDTKSSSPKLLFSPVAAVEASDVDAIVRQGKSQAADKAVKLTVYKQDKQTDNGEFPAAPPEAEVTPAEPVLRKTDAAAAPDQADIIKRWSKK
jgi:hypothetical protein